MQEFNRQIIAIFDNSHVSSETYPSPRVLHDLQPHFDLQVVSLLLPARQEKERASSMNFTIPLFACYNAEP